MAAGTISAETVARIEREWAGLLAKVAEGEPIGASIRAVGLSPDMVRIYRGMKPQRDVEWQRAREQSADAFADKVVDVVDGNGDPADKRVKMDAYRWIAAKRNPKQYSDKAQLDINVKTVDLTRIIEAANARLASVRRDALPIMDAEIVPHNSEASGVRAHDTHALPAPSLADLL
jgi:hypothetical protein